LPVRLAPDLVGDEPRPPGGSRPGPSPRPGRHWRCSRQRSRTCPRCRCRRRWSARAPCAGCLPA